MDRGSVPRPARRAKGRKRRRPGLVVVERDGFWHIYGTVVAQGRRVRVRKSTHLEALPARWSEADAERHRIETEIRGELRGEVGPGPHLSIAAELYLTRPRTRPLGTASIAYVQAVVRDFGFRGLGDIREGEWAAWVEQSCRGVKSATRERMVNSLMAFLNWCAKKPRQWGSPPMLDRDKEARNPRRRARRSVQDLSLPLVEHLIAHASPHLAAQLWTEWSTGARVSSILHGCRLSDLILAPGREQITFHGTKNGETVTAHLHPRAAAALRTYLEVRGRLHDREGPLFLTHRGLLRGAKPHGVHSDEAQGAGRLKAPGNGRSTSNESGRQRRAIRVDCQDAGRPPPARPHHPALVPASPGDKDARRHPSRHGPGRMD